LRVCFKTTKHASKPLRQAFLAAEGAVTGIPKVILPTGLEVADVLGFVRHAYEEDPRFQNERYTYKLVNKEGWWYTQNERLVIPNVDAVKHAVIQECSTVCRTNGYK
jgi:hypothetical protein